MSNIHTVNSLPSRAPPSQSPFGAQQQTGEPTNYSRLIPLVTILVSVSCFLLWLTNISGAGPTPSHYSNCPANALSITSFYRYFLAGFLHLGFLHMFFNMLIVLMLGIGLERAIGSLPLLGSIFSSVFFVHVLYNIIYYFASLFTEDSTYLHTCVVGYSGVIFAHLWMHIVCTGITHINCCTLRIPARAYPFILLILMSLFGGSFAAHFCGLVFGIMYTYGFLNIISVPRSWLVNFEKNTKVGRFLCMIPIYCQVPAEQNHLFAEENVHVTRVKYEDVQDNILVKICTWICCLPCVLGCKPRPGSGNNNAGARTSGPIRGSGAVYNNSNNNNNTAHTWQGTGHSLSEPDQPQMTAPSSTYVDRTANTRAAPPSSGNSVQDIDMEDLEQGGRRNTQNRGMYSQLDDYDDTPPLTQIHVEQPAPPTPEHSSQQSPVQDPPAIDQTQQPYNPNERADPRRTRPGKPVSRLLQ